MAMQSGHHGGRVLRGPTPAATRQRHGGAVPPVIGNDMIAFAEALARAQVARDIATLRAAQNAGQLGDARAHGDLRALQQR